jgi:hypothetical protein
LKIFGLTNNHDFVRLGEYYNEFSPECEKNRTRLQAAAPSKPIFGKRSVLNCADEALVFL